VVAIRPLLVLFVGYSVDFVLAAMNTFGKVLGFD
jgi:hypothetical protein